MLPKQQVLAIVILGYHLITLSASSSPAAAPEAICFLELPLRRNLRPAIQRAESFLSAPATRWKDRCCQKRAIRFKLSQPQALKAGGCGTSSNQSRKFPKEFWKRIGSWKIFPRIWPSASEAIPLDLWFSRPGCGEFPSSSMNRIYYRESPTGFYRGLQIGYTSPLKIPNPTWIRVRSNGRATRCDANF